MTESLSKVNSFLRVLVDKISSSKLRLFIFFAVCVFTLYFRTLYFSWTEFDDNVLIVNQNYFLSDPSNIIKAFQVDVFLENFSPYYRPVLTVTFIIDTLIGGKEPLQFHLTNILIHLLAVFVLCLIMIKISDNISLSLLSAIIFAVHPINSQAIAWIPGRNDSLLTLFSLLSFLLLFYISNEKKYKAIICVFLHIIFFILALFTKETALLLPVVFLVYFIFILKDKIIRKYLIFLIPIWITSILSFLFLRSIYITTPTETFIHIRILKNAIIGIISYLQKFFLPVNLTPIPFIDSPDILFLIFSVIVIILLSRILKIENKSKFSFGIFWYIIFISPTFIQIDNYSYFLEHRAYMSLIGLFISFSQIRFNYKIKFQHIFALVFLIALAGITVNHLQYFSNKENFWNEVIKSYPDKPHGYNFFGNEYAKSGNKEKALFYYKKALSVAPFDENINNNYGYVLSKIGEKDEAEKYFLIALKSKPDFPKALNNLANVYIFKNKFTDAEQLLKKAVNLAPRYYEAYNNLGIVYSKLNKNNEAENSFLKSIEINPFFTEVYFNLTLFYFKSGNKDKARYYYNSGRIKGLKQIPELEKLLN